MKNIVLSFGILLITVNLNAQGCSDAGFCTLNSFKGEVQDSISSLKSEFNIGLNYGEADHSISAIGIYLAYNRQISRKISLNAKLTTLGQSGNDISTYGMSDLFLSGDYNLNDKLSTTIGVKIPLADGNGTQDNGLALPMDYQSSLGTFDLIFGFGYQIKRLKLNAAIQQPLDQNKNSFLASDHPINSPLRKFQSTNKFERSGDVLLRATYVFSVGKKFVISPSLLPIYHLNNDKYTDVLGVEREIEGSQGLTLNGNLYVDYNINDSNALQFIIGVPFVIRDARPDGLTRSFVANLEYKIRF